MSPVCRGRCAALLLGAAIVLGSGAARGDTITLAPVRDNSLIEDAAGARSNGSGDGIFVGRNSGGVLRRGVLAFDVAGALPSGSTIQDVTLTLFVSNVSDSIPRTISLHRVLADWGEGASAASGGSGAPSQPGDATWLHRFYPDSLWSTPGGDFESGVAGAADVGDVGFYVWSGVGLVTDLQFWLDHPGADFGWLLQGNETDNGSAKRFDSRETAEPANRPSLAVTFTPPDVPVRPATWGRLKSRYRPFPAGSRTP